MASCSVVRWPALNREANFCCKWLQLACEKKGALSGAVIIESTLLVILRLSSTVLLIYVYVYVYIYMYTSTRTCQNPGAGYQRLSSPESAHVSGNVGSCLSFYWNLYWSLPFRQLHLSIHHFFCWLHHTRGPWNSVGIKEIFAHRVSQTIR